jgi:hypothetical protein
VRLGYAPVAVTTIQSTAISAAAAANPSSLIGLRFTDDVQHDAIVFWPHNGSLAKNSSDQPLGIVHLFSAEICIAGLREFGEPAAAL